MSIAVYRKIILVAILAGIVANSGCVASQKVNLSSPFDALETKRLLEKGSNTVRGSALIRQRGGGVVTCAGQEVHLIPATAYASERVRAIYRSDDGGYSPALGGRKITFDGDVLEYQSLRAKTRCDAQGYFKFDQLTNGSFYVGTAITWKVNDYFTEGGALIQRVSVTGGETKEIVLSP